MKADAVSIPLGKVLEAPIDSGYAIARAKGLGFEVDCDPGMLVQVDPQLTTSALNNLIDNAVKYTDSGTVKVSCKAKGDAVEVHVHDNCPGMSPEELRTIFEPFRRGNHPKKPGSGLGLAIAKRAVEAQGGEISAESPGQRGCHFWFTLPRAAS